MLFTNSVAVYPNCLNKNNIIYYYIYLYNKFILCTIILLYALYNKSVDKKNKCGKMLGAFSCVTRLWRGERINCVGDTDFKPVTVQHRRAAAAWRPGSLFPVPGGAHFVARFSQRQLPVRIVPRRRRWCDFQFDWTRRPIILVNRRFASVISGRRDKYDYHECTNVAVFVSWPLTKVLCELCRDLVVRVFCLSICDISFLFPSLLFYSCTRESTTKMSAMILWIVTAIIAITTTANAAGLKCDNVRPIFEAQGFPLSDIPKEAISCELDSTLIILEIIQIYTIDGIHILLFVRNNIWIS